MKKDIVQIDTARGIYQITTTDERWYSVEATNEESGLPEFKFIPSVTWITGFYPKGVSFYKWLANTGWDEAEAIKVEAGDKGSKIHNLIDNLINGGVVRLTDSYFNENTKQEEEIKPEEYEALLSFKAWVNETKPQFLTTDYTVISKENNYAGTIDAICLIKDTFYIVDFKTSQYIWPSMELQVSAYKHALQEMPEYKDKEFRLAILQIGYTKNKKKFKFTEVEDKFNLFLNAKSIWLNETEGQKPSQKEFPLEIVLEKPVVEEKKEEVKSINKINNNKKSYVVTKKRVQKA